MASRDQGAQQPTILCVDDEPDVLSALDQLLRRHGCRVLLAENGSDALRLLQRERVEVLICDEAMPGMCGTEVLCQAKLIAPQTVRVMLTAHCNDGAVVIPAVHKGEIFGLIQKPWEEQDVCHVIADALRLEHPTRGRFQERVREESEADFGSGNAKS
jgi:response regulator RpfG family c-di-GMP phosphodiesterase